MTQIVRAPNVRAKLIAGNYRVSPAFRVPNLPFSALLAAGSAAVASQKLSTFSVDYVGFDSAAKGAFGRAVDIWSTTLASPVTVRVSATWRDLGNPNILGQATAAGFVSGSDIGLNARPDTFYPLALACKLAGSDLAPGGVHIEADFNSSFPNWHFGLDGDPPPSEYDLVTVVLHELGHGLGFLGSGFIDDTGLGRIGLQGAPIIWDRFIVNAEGESIFDANRFPDGSTELAGQLTSSRLFFNGTLAVEANGGSAPQIYAPLTFEGGSSYSHLDESTFASGTPNALMTPQFGLGEVIHRPGPIIRSVLRDLGW